MTNFNQLKLGTLSDYQLKIINDPNSTKSTAEYLERLLIESSEVNGPRNIKTLGLYESLSEASEGLSSKLRLNDNTPESKNELVKYLTDNAPKFRSTVVKLGPANISSLYHDFNGYKLYSEYNLYLFHEDIISLMKLFFEGLWNTESSDNLFDELGIVAVNNLIAWCKPISVNHVRGIMTTLEPVEYDLEDGLKLALVASGSLELTMYYNAMIKYVLDNVEKE